MSAARTVVVLTDDGAAEVPGSSADASVRIAREHLAAATGWELKPEGLCRDEICVPVRDTSSLVVDGEIDVAELGRVLGRVTVIDADEGVASLGDSPVEREALQRSLRAPDFELPDLDGNLVAMRDLTGRRRLLVAWASW